MNIGGYESLPGANPSGDAPFLAIRDGRQYLLRRCDARMTDARVKQLRGRLNDAALPGGSLLVPELMWAQSAWYAAVPLGDEGLRDVPPMTMAVLGRGQQRRLVLSAVNALAALERAGLVHGSVDRNAFQLNLAGDGALTVRLQGLESAGNADGRDGMSPFRRGSKSCQAPEIARGARAAFVEDVFALGVCVHEWLTGELPLYRGVTSRQELLIASSIPAPLATVLGMMLAPDPNQRPLASALSKLLARDITVRSAFTYQTYESAPVPDDYARILLDGIRAQCPKLKTNLGASAKGWS